MSSSAYLLVNACKITGHYLEMFQEKNILQVKFSVSKWSNLIFSMGFFLNVWILHLKYGSGDKMCS